MEILKGAGTSMMSRRGSFSAYAVHIGKTPAYVSKLKRHGRLVLVKNEAGKAEVDFDLSDRLVRNTADPSRAGSGANARRSPARAVLKAEFERKRLATALAVAHGRVSSIEARFAALLAELSSLAHWMAGGFDEEPATCAPAPAVEEEWGGSDLFQQCIDEPGGNYDDD